jgi:hypothetical protein
MGKSVIVKEYNGEGHVRGATFVEFKRTFGFNKGTYRIQMADAPEIPFGEYVWERSWWEGVLRDTVRVSHHKVRTPSMMFESEECETLILKLDQGGLRKNFDKYGWYERVFKDKEGHVNTHKVGEKGDERTLFVPRTVSNMFYRNIKTNVVELDMDHDYIVGEVKANRIWAPPENKSLVIEYCIAYEVWRGYARQFNEWQRQIRFLNEELGVEEVFVCAIN